MSKIKVFLKIKGGETGTKQEVFAPEEFGVSDNAHSVLFDGSGYRYTAVLDSDCTQKETYQKACKDVVTRAFEGFNGTIFVYGCSGSGKTYTMLGPDSAIDAFSKKEFIENGKKLRDFEFYWS